ncbi:hypothetical protein B0J12DRAFT_747898 [Macrophomina phaseolina]|uniref:Uncharacterized protein n=1 Tax=Macrophomina phaseolina TaxID=35725 RepID=A0ABQ8GU52_9PEZI|nr:hypothetical protein B0J12DRAFT_747898 [Macrophomina phaseolina]
MACLIGGASLRRKKTSRRVVETGIFGGTRALRPLAVSLLSRTISICLGALTAASAQSAHGRRDPGGGGGGGRRDCGVRHLRDKSATRGSGTFAAVWLAPAWQHQRGKMGLQLHHLEKSECRGKFKSKKRLSEHVGNAESAEAGGSPCGREQPQSKERPGWSKVQRENGKTTPSRKQQLVEAATRPRTAAVDPLSRFYSEPSLQERFRAAHAKESRRTITLSYMGPRSEAGRPVHRKIEAVERIFVCVVRQCFLAA